MNALNNFANFSAKGKFKQAAIAFIAAQCLTKAEKQSIDKIFRALDQDGDGHIVKEDIQQGFLDYFDKKLSDQEV